MKRFLRGLGLGLLTFLVAVALFLFGMRFADGPVAVFTGGQFTSGVQENAPDDWDYLKERSLIEFQTLSPARSRTVWLAVHDKRLFIVSGYMNTGYGAIWKQWPHRLKNDNRIVLRVDDKLYEQRLKRLMEHPRLLDLVSIYSEKYGVNWGDGGQDLVQVSLADGDFWLYEVVQR